MKKIVYLVLALMLVGIVSAECDYYVGDEITLPQITTTKTYDDGATHKMYLACLYSLTGEGANFESMISTQSCRENVDTFSPSSAGDYTYDLNIYYRERQWNPTTHIWQTISEGTDNSLQETYEICEVPDDDDGLQDFIDWIMNILCQMFGVFCNNNNGNSEWLYQETANEIGCKYPWDSVNTCAKSYDGDWDVYGHSEIGEEAYLFLNYSKPINSSSTSLWQMKDSGGTFNLTINNDCWSQEQLQFRVWSLSTGGAYWHCWDGTSWSSLRIYGGANSYIYEEAIWWNIN